MRSSQDADRLGSGGHLDAISSELDVDSRSGGLLEENIAEEDGFELARLQTHLISVCSCSVIVDSEYGLVGLCV